MEELSSAQMFLLRRKPVHFKALPVKHMQKQSSSFSAQISQVTVENNFQNCFPDFFCTCWCVLVPPMSRQSFGLAEHSRTKPCHSPWAQALCWVPMYLLPCGWHQVLLALQKGKRKGKLFSWCAQLPCSVRFSSSSLCRLFAEQEGENCIVKKVEICQN